MSTYCLKPEYENASYSNPYNIKDINEFIFILSYYGCAEFFISFGFARSSKRIAFEETPQKLEILHYIDDSEEILYLDDIDEKTNIFKSIKTGSFYFAGQ